MYEGVILTFEGGILTSEGVIKISDSAILISDLWVQHRYLLYMSEHDALERRDVSTYLYLRGAAL